MSSNSLTACAPWRLDSLVPSGPWISETITVLETHLDNERGDTLGHAAQRLMQEGALDVVSMAPMAIPPIVMAMAILLLYLRTPLYGTIMILIVGHMTIYLAFASRTMSSALVQLHKELADAAHLSRLGENEKRLAIRAELAEHNKALAAAAKEAGVESSLDYAIFQDHGYRGLYGGLGNKEIHARKGLKKSQKILDHMGSTELAANLFRATQAEEKLRRDQIQGKAKANQTHLEVGKKVRQTIAELGGTMPENLPTPEESIRQLESSRKKLKTQ